MFSFKHVWNGRFDVFTAVNFQVEFFWVVTQWRWRQNWPLKRWFLTSLHSITTQKTSTWRGVRFDKEEPISYRITK